MSTKVVVVGGGYGGIGVAKSLDAEPDVEVYLVDTRDSFVNAAGSLRAVSQPDWAPNMFFAYDDLLTNGTFVRDSVVSVDPSGVETASGRRIDADYIVLATGSDYVYPAKPRSDTAAAALEDLRKSHKELAAADRVLVVGAGPVGLELAGEAKLVWPDKTITVVDPAGQLLPGFLPEVRADLEKQLDELGVVVRTGVGLDNLPDVPAGVASTFTVTTTAGDDLTADIWFRAFGVDVNSSYLADGKLIALTPQGEVPVDAALNVTGYEHVFALGDIVALGETKMAGYAMQHADVVAKNIAARIKGDPADATYAAATVPMILLPLGPNGGVGQLPGEDGPFQAPLSMVSEFKGNDLFTARFAAMFAPAET